MGQGEYVVFHKMPNGKKEALSFETFEQVYKILIQYSPTTLINSGSEKASDEYAKRYELVKAKLKEIDLTLEAVFVPRTLYELVFIRKCIKEDMKHKKICLFLNSNLQTAIHYPEEAVLTKITEEQKEGIKTERLRRKCWHLCYFTDAGNNEHAGVKEVAYRLNRTMLKALDPSEGFTYEEFSAFAEKEIEFLKSHYKKNGSKQCNKDEKVEEISDCSNPGPTTNFGFESNRGSIKPMGIRNETDAQIIRDAIALDCSKVAQHSLFLYRGADFQKDVPFHWSNKDNAYSLSYGSSLFAGCLYDGGATAFHYMRNGKNAYAIPVPFDQLNDSPFYVPTTHIAAQLFGDGEIFHARTKAWKDFDIQKLGGMNKGANGDVREHLKSNLSQGELVSQFNSYKNKAIQLK